MRKELWSLLVLTLCGAVFLWDASSADGQIFGRRHRHQADCVPCPPPPVCVQEERASTVCRLQQMINMGTYCTYYAEKCYNQYVGVNASCNLPLGGCPSGSGCMTVVTARDWCTPTTLAVTADHFTDPALRIKGVKKESIDYYKKNVKVDESVKDACEFLPGYPILVSLKRKDTGRDAKVLLYLALFNPARVGLPGLPRVFGVGVEVADDGTPAEPVLPEKVVQDGHSCRVKPGLGLAAYEVILTEKE
jgi:hypothetical protein